MLTLTSTHYITALLDDAVDLRKMRNVMLTGAVTKLQELPSSETGRGLAGCGALQLSSTYSAVLCCAAQAQSLVMGAKQTQA